MPRAEPRALPGGYSPSCRPVLAALLRLGPSTVAQLARACRLSESSVRLALAHQDLFRRASHFPPWRWEAREGVEGVPDA